MGLAIDSQDRTVSIDDLDVDGKEGGVRRWSCSERSCLSRRSWWGGPGHRGAGEGHTTFNSLATFWKCLMSLDSEAGSARAKYSCFCSYAIIERGRGEKRKYLAEVEAREEFLEKNDLGSLGSGLSDQSLSLGDVLIVGSTIFADKQEWTERKYVQANWVAATVTFLISRLSLGRRGRSAQRHERNLWFSFRKYWGGDVTTIIFRETREMY